MRRWCSARAPQNVSLNMEPLRLDTLAAQVVAWHNRHPLARRITAAQVHTMGYLVLPAMQVQVAEPALDAVQDAVPVSALGTVVDATVDVAVDASPAAVDGTDEPAVAPAVAELAVEAAEAFSAPAAAEEAATEHTEAVPVAPAPVADPVADPVAAAAPAPPAPSLRARLTARPAQAAPSVPVPAPAVGAYPATAATATANPRAQALRLACSEQVLDGLTRTPRLSRWVLQQARLLAVKLPADAPVRQVPRDAALSAVQPGVPEQPVQLLLRTATLEVGSRRLRLLVGPGVDPAVLGRRLWSLPRVAVACLPLLMLPLTAGAAWWLGAQSARQAQVQVQAQVHDVPATAAHAASAVAPLAAHAASATHASAAHHAASAADGASAAFAADAASAASAAYAASAAFAAYAASAVQVANDATAPAPMQPPLDTEPRQGRIELPPLGPLFADPGLEPTRLRRQAVRAARAAAAVAAASQPETLVTKPLPQAAAVPTASPAATPTAGAKAAPTAAYALTTRPLRTAAESEQVQVAMRTLLTLSADAAARVQRVPVGDDWRVMGGPFASRAEAEKARALLLARGVKTEVVDIPPAPSLAAATAPVAR